MGRPAFERPLDSQRRSIEEEKKHREQKVHFRALTLENTTMNDPKMVTRMYRGNCITGACAVLQEIACKMQLPAPAIVGTLWPEEENA